MVMSRPAPQRRECANQGVINLVYGINVSAEQKSCCFYSLSDSLLLLLLLDQPGSILFFLQGRPISWLDIQAKLMYK